MVKRAVRAISGGCLRRSPTLTTSGSRRWGCDSPAAEADPSLLGAVELHVADLLGRDQDLPALLVADDEHAAVAQCRGQGALDLVRGGRRVEHQFSLDGLDTYLDFHGDPLTGPQQLTGLQQQGRWRGPVRGSPKSR